MERIIIIGPYPPPDHGTSVPFKYLVDYLMENAAAEVIMINAESGDKAGIALYEPKALIPFFHITANAACALRKGGTLFIYGSQRFIATVGSLYSLIYSGILRQKTVIYIQGGAFEVYYQSKNRLPRILIRFCLNRSYMLGVQTILTYRILSNEFRAVTQIPNWINLSSEDTMPIPNADHLIEDGSVRTFRLVFIGDVIPEKGIHELLDACKKARQILEKEGNNLTLDIYGPTMQGSEEIVLKDISSQESDTFYHGQTNHDSLMKGLNSYHALVLPTKFPTEGYPGVILEAMSLGLPVIATRHRAIPEIIKDGYNGLLCDTGDVSSLTEAILRMALYDEDRERMGINARNTARKFDIEVVLKDMCKQFGLPSKQE